MDISGLQKEIVMPAKSEKQRRFMALVSTGKKKVKGLSPEKAHEFMYKSKDKK